ncbi:MAG: ATP-binding cassette domain-containing protein [Treponema sp.]|nr:ATP-binding cassette domain-containing protein [Treponema sp.]
MICAEGLYFSYTGTAPWILNNLCFTAEDGEYISIVGSNGAGKSTLVKLLLGLLSPLRGSISVTQDRTAFVPQANDLADSHFPVTVREMLDSYRRLLKIKDRNRTDEALAAVGMQAVSDRLISTLSGGQRQKVFIARGIIGDPSLLVLDEPSAGVDPESRKEIYAYLKKLNSEKTVTILSVEHNLDAVVRNSTAIYHMSGGSGHMCSPETYRRELVFAGGGAV